MSTDSRVNRQASTQDAADLSEMGVGQWSFAMGANRYHCSSACCRLRELDPEQAATGFSRDAWWHCVHPEDRVGLDKEMEKLLSGNAQQISVRYRVQISDKSVTWLLTRASLSPTATDDESENIEVVDIKGVDIDITEFHEEQRESALLKEQTERFEVAMESAQVGLWHIDIPHNIRSESDTWRTIRGHPADSDYGAGNGWYHDIHPDDLSLVFSNDPKKMGDNEDAINYSYRQRHTSGEWRWIWSRGTIAQRDTKGHAAIITGADTDITEIKHAESRYERLSSTLDIAMTAAGMGVWEWTLNASDNVWDQRTRKIFGIDKNSELVSHASFLNLVHPDDRAELDRKMQACVAKLDDMSVEYRIINPHKGVRYIKSNASCHSSAHESTRYVGIVWDITEVIVAKQERSSLAERLSHGQRLQSIGELTGGIAHDFNNLLAIISGNAELLIKTSSNQESSNLSAIMSASQQGAELTRSLLAFARKQALRPTSIDMGAVLRKLSSMLDRTLPSTISIGTQVSRDLWQCEADCAQVENALLNLIVNARDAMPKGGSIIIRAENQMLDENFASLADDLRPGEFVSVSVSDTGIGMSSPVLEKSIDPFFTTKAIGDGNGMGLSMVFGFMKQSKGHMTIESEENKGTTVSLYFPRNEGKVNAPVAEPRVPASLPMGNGEHILLVEDDLSVQQMISKLLEYLGYTTNCVGSGDAALMQLRKNDEKIGLVITDIVLSEGMNGFELGQEIAAQYPDINIVYISGYAEDALRAQRTGAKRVEVLKKPFSIDKLAAHIAKQLSPDLA